MSTFVSSPSRTASAVSTKQKVGLVLCILYSLANIPSFLEGSPNAGQDGPPESILVICSVLGVVGVVCAVLAWRGSNLALRVAAGAVVVSTLTSLPAFFVDVPMWLQALVAFSVVLAVAIVVLMFSSDRRPAAVTD